MYSTFLGGALSDRPQDVHVDATGFATVVGHTRSRDFPTTPDAWDRTLDEQDAFVTRLQLTAPAGVRRYGNSMPACSGPIAIEAFSTPRVEWPLWIGCSNAPPATRGWLVLGAGGRSTALPYAGIEVWIDPTHPTLYVPVSTDAAGDARLLLGTLPAGTQGARLFAQLVWVNTAACGGAGTLSASDAAEITVQR